MIRKDPSPVYTATSRVTWCWRKKDIYILQAASLPSKLVSGMQTLIPGAKVIHKHPPEQLPVGHAVNKCSTHFTVYLFHLLARGFTWPQWSRQVIHCLRIKIGNFYLPLVYEEIVQAHRNFCVTLCKAKKKNNIQETGSLNYDTNMQEV